MVKMHVDEQMRACIEKNLIYVRGLLLRKQHPSKTDLAEIELLTKCIKEANEAGT